MKVSSFQLWTPKGREPTAAGVQNKKFWILKAHSCIAIATVIFSFLPQPISCMKFSLSAIATTVLNPIQPLYFDKKFIRTCNLLGVKYCVNCLDPSLLPHLPPTQKSNCSYIPFLEANLKYSENIFEVCLDFSPLYGVWKTE